MVAEALRSGADVVWGALGDEYAASDAGLHLTGLAAAAGVELETFPDRDVLALADTETPRPVLLVVRPRPPAPAAEAPPGRYLYLDAVQDPGNVGTLVRSAWAFGLSGVVVGTGTADPWSPKVVRASAGGVFHLPLLADLSPEPWPRWPGAFLYAEAGREHADDVAVRAGPDWVLAVGNEGAGVSPRVRALGRPVSLAMRPGVDSLNAAVAGSILMYVLTHHRPPDPEPPRP